MLISVTVDHFAIEKGLKLKRNLVRVARKEGWPLYIIVDGEMHEFSDELAASMRLRMDGPFFGLGIMRTSVGELVLMNQPQEGSPAGIPIPYNISPSDLEYLRERFSRNELSKLIIVPITFGKKTARGVVVDLAGWAGPTGTKFQPLYSLIEGAIPINPLPCTIAFCYVQAIQRARELQWN